GANGGGSNLPDFGSVDRLPDPAVAQLAFKVQPTLESFGLIRASREDLQAPLPPSVHVSSNLAGAAPTQFDALFYWMD
ncbi:MAG: hypothetical protein JWP29_3356, partial [Rhodoferax sp.]|nr:hypothetical protein [Rhodoferax sp.]